MAEEQHPMNTIEDVGQAVEELLSRPSTSTPPNVAARARAQVRYAADIEWMQSLADPALSAALH